MDQSTPSTASAAGAGGVGTGGIHAGVYGEKTQTIVFLRHGVAKHNLLDEKTRTPADVKDPNLFDPPLVLEGKRQALESGDRIRVWWHTTQAGEQLELVITSPLTRCLQTTSLAFLAGDRYCQDLPEPTVACLEVVREAYGMSYPDRRRNKGLLESSWPRVHFDPAMSAEDELWKLTERESVPDVVGRVNHFFQWVVQRPESNLAVVSHGVWIECCFYAHCPTALSNGDRVRNGDVFAGECVSQNGVFQRLQNVRRIE